MSTRFIGVFAGCSLLGMAHVASAQTAAAAGDPAAGSSSAVLEEVIVTARRKEESLQDVPLVVQAVTSDDMAKLNIRDFKEITSIVPGLQLNSNANGIGTTASMRGVNYDVNASGNNGTIEFYFNDMPGAGNFAFQSMFDVGQIEVLRGPQGTLRGRSSPSGSITITTRRPDLNEFGGYASLTSNDIGGQNINGALNFPIIDGKLAVRVSGLNDESQGNRVRSAINPNVEQYAKTRAGRVSINFQPNDSFNALLVANRLETRSLRYDQVESANIMDPTAAASTAATGGFITAKDRLAVGDVPGSVRQSFDQFSLQTEWKFAGQRLNFSGAQMNQHFQSQGSGDGGNFFGTSFPASLQNFGQFTNTHAYSETYELRLSNQDPLFGHLDYVVGGFGSHLSSPTDLSSPTIINLVTAPATGPQPVPSGSTTWIISQTAIARRGTAKEQSVFANFTYKADALELSAGARRISYNNKGHLAIAGAQVAAAEDDSTFHKTVYNASAKYRFNENFMAYVSTGSSFRPGISVTGDFSVAQSPLERSFLVLQPETSKSYELGIKTTWLDGRLTEDVAIFRQTFSNYVWRSPSGVAYISTQAPGATPNVAAFNFVGGVPVTVDGIEVQTNYRANRNWTIGGMAAYSSGKIDNGLVPCNDYTPHDGIPDTVAPPTTVAGIQAGAGTENLTGCRVNFRSAFQGLFNASAQTEYSRPVKGYDGFLRGQLSYFGDSKNDPTNPLDDVKSYSLLNLFFGLRDPKAGWEIMVYGKNVTNTFRVLNRANGPITAGWRTFNGTPGLSSTAAWTANTTYRGVGVTAAREVGVTMRYAFGSK